MTDNINHPPHYTYGQIQPADVMDDWELGRYEALVIKYIARAKHKGSELEDLKKAQWYLNRRIEKLQEGYKPTIKVAEGFQYTGEQPLVSPSAPKETFSKQKWGAEEWDEFADRWVQSYKEKRKRERAEYWNSLPSLKETKEIAIGSDYLWKENEGNIESVRAVNIPEEGCVVVHPKESKDRPYWAFPVHLSSLKKYKTQTDNFTAEMARKIKNYILHREFVDMLSKIKGDGLK